MNNTGKWILGIALGVILLLGLPFLAQLFLPHPAYGMMGYGYGWNMPMMYGGYGMMPFGMLWMWLIPLGLLVLIVLAILWLVRALLAPRR